MTKSNQKNENKPVGRKDNHVNRKSLYVERPSDSSSKKNKAVISGAGTILAKNEESKRRTKAINLTVETW